MRAGGWPLAVLALWAALALLGPLAGPDPERIELAHILEPPGAGAWLGRDDLGRDLWARVAAGARTSLAVAAGVLLVTSLAGTALGIVAGWFGGALDVVIQRLIEIAQAFPGLLLAIALAAVLGGGVAQTILALAATAWVGFARLARAQTLSVRTREHVAAAQALGTPTAAILTRHVLPLVLAPLVVETSFTLAAAVIGEAGLAFLGLGVQPPAPSWGTMIRDGVAYMLVAPHTVIVPGLALVAVVLAANLLGDRLRDAIDPRLGRLRWRSDR